MARIGPLVSLLVLVSATFAATSAVAVGPWDGEYRGEGKFDIDRNCVPREFEATGIVDNNVLTLSILRKGKVIRKVELNITAGGSLDTVFLCSSGRSTAYIRGTFRDNEIRLNTLPMPTGRGRGGGGSGGEITLALVAKPQAAPPRQAEPYRPPIQPPAPSAIQTQPPSAVAPAPAPTAPALDRASLRNMQQDLKSLGYYYGSIDGVFGPETREAIAAYQRTLQAPPTGVLSANQLRRLLADVERTKSRQSAATATTPAAAATTLATATTPATAAATAPATATATATATAPSSTSELELAFWDAIKNSEKADEYRAYLQSYPNGRFAPLAQLRAERFASAARGAEASQATAPAVEFKIQFGRYHAIVIGNNDYVNMPKLKMSINDAAAVAETLERLYGFKVELLTNVTRYDILSVLSKARAELTEEDNLLVYYAGHGVIDEETGRGYWLPVDAEPDIVANWISNTTLSDMIKAIQAKHVMVVADSCYSGTLVRAASVRLKTGGDQTALWNRMAAKRSRTALVSGGLEPVMDSGGGNHSVFAKAFLDALYENKAVLDGQSLFAGIQRKVVVNSEQTPQYSDIRGAGHDGGDFLFVRR